VALIDHSDLSFTQLGRAVLDGRLDIRFTLTFHNEVKCPARRVIQTFSINTPYSNGIFRFLNLGEMSGPCLSAALLTITAAPHPQTRLLSSWGG
jgi:hypothetical protein